MTGGLAALAWNGFREARRNRVTVVLAIFAVGIIFSGVLLTEASVAAVGRVLVDVGLGGMSLAMVLLSVFLSSGLVSREIERRTIFLVVSKPISRAGYLLGRLAGNMITVTALLVGMVAIFALQLRLYGVPMLQPYMAAIGGLWFELLLLSSIGLALSSFSGQIVSSVVTLALYFAGHLSDDLYALADHSKSDAIRTIGKGAYYLLPNLERLNFRGQATYSIWVPGTTFAFSALYAMAYSVAIVSIGVIVFRRRDFK